jgi:ubiquinone/menaquinone biosynthesis C-methylase UbiE
VRSIGVKEKYRAKGHYQNKGVAEQYDQERFGSPLGKFVDWLEKTALQKALKRVGRASAALDIPCGTGRITEFLLTRGFEVTGADISDEMLEVAQRRVGSYSGFRGLVRQDAEHLDFQDKSFDFVVSSRFFGHLPSSTRIQVLKEMGRVTREVVIVAYFITDFLSRISKHIQRIGKKVDFVTYPVSMRNAKLEVDAADMKILQIVPMCRGVSECYYFVLTRKGRNLESSGKT